MPNQARPTRFARLARAVFGHVPRGVAAVLAALAPCPGVAQSPEDSTRIRMRTEAYVDAWDAHDPAALGRFFTEDADFVMGNLPGARGPSQIADSWREYFALQEPERRLRLDVRSLRFLTPEVAVMSVGTTTHGKDPEGRDLVARRFRGVWLWHREADGWTIAAMHGLPTEEDEVVLNASVEAAEALRPDIRGFVAAYEDAFDSKDPAAVGAFYRHDAEIIVRNSPPISGRDAIEGWWRAYFREGRPYRVLLVIENVRMLSETVALLDIIGTGAVTGTGAAPARAAGDVQAVRYTRARWVLTEDEAGWRIAQLLVLPSEYDQIERGARRPGGRGGTRE